MEIIFHPRARTDILEALRYYHDISEALAGELQSELAVVFQQEQENPDRFPVVEQRFHRANLRRFPYHVLYGLREGAVRIVLIRHHKRRPEFGMERR